MDRFLPIVPLNLTSLLKENRYKIIIYPIMIIYYTDPNVKYNEADINKKMKKLNKSFSDFLSKLEENSTMQTTILNYIRDEIASELKQSGISMRGYRLFKSKMSYFSSVDKNKPNDTKEYSKLHNSSNSIVRARMPYFSSFELISISD